MSVGSSAKTQQEYFEWVRDLYKKKNPGCFTAEQVVEWGVTHGHLDEPRINARAILVKKFKTSLRTCRIIDRQNRKVRGYLPAKIPVKTDDKGNLIFDVVWDHIHEMSADHAMLSFTQRDENIEKQKRSATRDVGSFLDNNPNALGIEDQFLFGFMIEDSPPPPKTDYLSETPQKPKKVKAK